MGRAPAALGADARPAGLDIALVCRRRSPEHADSKALFCDEGGGPIHRGTVRNRLRHLLTWRAPRRGAVQSSWFAPCLRHPQLRARRGPSRHPADARPLACGHDDAVRDAVGHFHRGRLSPGRVGDLERLGGRAMNVRWRLRMAAAQHEVWTGAELRRSAGGAGRPGDVGRVGLGAVDQAARPAEVVRPWGRCARRWGAPRTTFSRSTSRPVEAQPKPAKAAEAPAKAVPGPVDATAVRIADCVRCGGGDRLPRRAAVPSLPRPRPGSTDARILPETAASSFASSRHRPLRALLAHCADCGHVLRFKTSVRCRACRRRAEAAAAKSPCPRCGRAGLSSGRRRAGAGHAPGGRPAAAALGRAPCAAT